MTKILTPTVLATLFAISSFSALADGPNFYGRLDISLTNTETGSTIQGGTSGLTLGERGTYFENNFSNIGVRGSENLLDGVEIIYNMEFQVESVTGSGETFKARNAYLGVSLDVGTFMVGRNDTVFKLSEGGFDIFGNTNADMDSVITGQTRSADGIWYFSPVIADVLTLNANYLMKDNQDSDDTQYALSATLGDKSLRKQMYYVAAAYNKAIGGIDAYRMTGQVKVGNTTLGGLFQNTESLKNTQQKGNSYFVNMAYDLNGYNLKAEYGIDEAGFGEYFSHSNGIALADDINVQSITLGVDRRLSKSTFLFAHYAMYEGDYKIANAKTTLADDNVISMGVRYDF